MGLQSPSAWTEIAMKLSDAASLIYRVASFPTPKHPNLASGGETWAYMANPPLQVLIA